MAEVKAVYQNIDAALKKREDDGSLVFDVHNRFYFTPLSEYELHYNYVDATGRRMEGGRMTVEAARRRHAGGVVTFAGWICRRSSGQFGVASGCGDAFYG